jgi:O6-methylguanine-DNA--protein-cysteine methyltransferase
MLGAEELTMMDLHCTPLDTPIGRVLVVTDREARVRACDFHDYTERMHRLLGQHYRAGYTLHEGGGPTPVMDHFRAYFAGHLEALDALTVATGGTAFQRDVWAALRRIPRGSTWSYSQLAEHLGRPRAVRAVGLANGQTRSRSSCRATA